MKKGIKVESVKVGFTGEFFEVGTLNIKNQVELDLANKVCDFAKEHDSKPCDVKSFFEIIEAMLPEGYKCGGGAHHIWIHPNDSEPFNRVFGVWLSHDVKKYEHMRLQEDTRILRERLDEDMKAYLEAKKAA
jgi:hypothetical protein